MNDGAQPGPYLAHSGNRDGICETLREHLESVARSARRFAAAFGSAEQAYAAGLLHDLGKYADQFQRRLRDPGERGRDHWTAGAAFLASTGGRLGLAPALAVAGHHAGLSELPGDGSRWAQCLLKQIADSARCEAAGRAPAQLFSETNPRLLLDRYSADGLPLPRIRAGLALHGQAAADMLDVRMLFSALVDADFLETEAHFQGDAEVPRRYRPEGPVLEVDRAIAALKVHLARVRRQHADSPMMPLRERLLRDCIASGAMPPGLFSLSAPTGSAKTLAMLAFALHHAKTHGLRRIVLVMPFLNIIEQTAQVYREIFSTEQGFHPGSVLEHHSLAEQGEFVSDGEAAGDGQTPSRLLAENWDAPIVLTTNVQLLESLMAHRPGRCRKLHRLARSVILFDEVQTLPAGLVVATLATLSRLADPDGPYRSTVLFATATQPTFETLDARVRQFAASGWRCRELATDVAPLFAAAAGRVRVCWRHREPLELDGLAAELRDHPRVLAIVNLKRHAVHVARALQDRGAKGLLHLSTNMCPAHRTRVLKKVRERLADGRPVRLVSTQCVEAGVDLDFPVVYRALAPLEAIAQAAGRCNRHGAGPTGTVIVFTPSDDLRLYPPGYGQAVRSTEIFLQNLASSGESLDDTEVLNDPHRLRAYFQQHYGLTGRATAELPDERELHDALRAGDFAVVARLYKLIKTDAINVLVPYDRAAFQRLRAELDAPAAAAPGFWHDWFRRAAPLSVSLYRPDSHADLWNLIQPVQWGRRPLENHEATWFVPLPGVNRDDLYDPLLGLTVRTEECWIA